MHLQVARQTRVPTAIQPIIAFCKPKITKIMVQEQILKNLKKSFFEAERHVLAGRQIKVNLGLLISFKDIILSKWK